MNELISVVVPCYNVGPFLAETLESVLNQTYTNWECIIVNDGSPDNTHEVALEWEKKDQRFIYLELKNGGVERARNKGIEKASGEYILPLDGDDKLAPTFLQKTIQVFKDDPDAMLVYTQVELFESKQGLWELKDFSLYNLAVANMIVCTAMYRKREWVRTGGYDEMVKYHWEDWELWINMLKGGGKVVRINEPLFFYRIRPSSGLRSVTVEKAAYMTKYITGKHWAFFHEQLGNPLTLYWELENQKALVRDLSVNNGLEKLAFLPLRVVRKINRMLETKKNRSVV